MTSDTIQPEAASTSTDEQTPPTTIEYSGDTSDQEIKLDLANRVSSTDGISDVEDFSIAEQSDGTQIASVTWTLDDGGTVTPASASETAPIDTAEDEEAAEDEDGEEDETEHEAESHQETPSDESDDGSAPGDADEGGGTGTDSTPSASNPSPPKTFEAALEAGVLQDVLAPVDALVEECRIHVDDDGLQIRVVDPAQVAMTDLQVSTAAFTAYQADTGTLGIKLDRLLDALGMARSDDLVQFSFDAERGKLTVTLDDLEYTMALLDPGSIRSEPDIPDLDLPAAITCDPAALKRTVTATDMVSDHVRLAVDSDDDCFHAEASGDTDEVRLEWDADDLVAFEPGEADALFALEYLKDMVGAIPRTAEIGLSLGEDFPCVLTYTVADSAADVECMLAPRIRED